MLEQSDIRHSLFLRRPDTDSRHQRRQPLVSVEGHVYNKQLIIIILVNKAIETSKNLKISTDWYLQCKQTKGNKTKLKYRWVNLPKCFPCIIRARKPHICLFCLCSVFKWGVPSMIAKTEWYTPVIASNYISPYKLNEPQPAKLTFQRRNRLVEFFKFALFEELTQTNKTEVNHPSFSNSCHIGKAYIFICRACNYQCSVIWISLHR